MKRQRCTPYKVRERDSWLDVSLHCVCFASPRCLKLGESELRGDCSTIVAMLIMWEKQR